MEQAGSPSNNKGSCTCRSTRRRLGLLYPGTDERSAPLEAAARRLGWEHDREVHGFTIPLGGSERFCSAAELADFVRALTPEVFDELQAVWLSGDLSLHQQRRALRHTVPLGRLTPAESGQLLPLLEQRALETWFQPVFRVDTLDVWGYECLLRATAPDGTLLEPDRLLQWAQAENLMFMLDRICREVHLAHAAEADVARHCHFLINFLPNAIYEPTVCLSSTIAAAMRYGLAPERLVFDVVESEHVPDRRRLREILGHYHDSGFGVALDDLGDDYAGLALLAELEPDLVKIDHEMVNGAADSTARRELCRAVAEYGRSRGKLVLAEGVERQADWEALRDLPIDLVQGFLFGRPEPRPLDVACRP